jgi:TDG/mug DNA glycosylase family protein
MFFFTLSKTLITVGADRAVRPLKTRVIYCCAIDCARNPEKPKMMPILPDLLAPNLKLVFCGTAASHISAREGAYYANPQNAFWPTIHQIGLTPRLFLPKEFRQLLDYHIGLTDLAKAAQGMDKALKKEDFDREALEQKILDFQPKTLAFTSKKAASVYFKTQTQNLSYGLQEKALGKTSIWILPSPSGAARSSWDITVWQALADTVSK